MKGGKPFIKRREWYRLSLPSFKGGSIKKTVKIIYEKYDPTCLTPAYSFIRLKEEMITIPDDFAYEVSSENFVTFMVQQCGKYGYEFRFWSLSHKDKDVYATINVRLRRVVCLTRFKLKKWHLTFLFVNLRKRTQYLKG